MPDDYLAEETCMFLPVLHMTFPLYLPGERHQVSLLSKISDPHRISFSRLEPTAQSRPGQSQFG